MLSSLPSPTHKCSAHGCEKRIPAHVFMCGHHWRSLRTELRNAYYGSSGLGKRALRWLAVGEICDDADKAVECMAMALEYQAQAIAAGERDPLEGLVPT